LRDEDAKAWLDTLRQRNEVDLTIEITERVLVEDSDNTHQVLHELDLAGIRIAIDDFGTGYSGLSYFSRFPVSVVKIDRSFVQGLTTSETETTLVETILLLANKLGVQVIAEGVEKESQAAFLRANHCDMLQGYHIAPPMPEKEFLEFVRRNRISTVENH
jgi:EAL domain-containing protein (putative c-di-GMP-specific phosphodiesterase class I)